MLNEQSLRTIFEKGYNRTEWYTVLRQNFLVETLREPAVEITGRIRSNDYSARAFELGTFETPAGQLVGLYEVAVPQKAQLYRNRRALRDLLSDIYRNDVEAALVVFVQDKKWRFTYVSEIAVRDAAGKRTRKSTDPKRYTYLFGEGEKALTAARQFSRIKPSEELFAKGVTLEALQEAFNVEKMSKAFFNEYRKHYGAFTAYLTGEDENSKEVRKASAFLNSTFNGNKKEARDFIKKMLGRIVFLYFLEKKGWLGVPIDAAWGKGDENFLSNLYQKSGDKDAFYSNVLAPLFFGALNTERKDDVFMLATGDKMKIPFLNGGLFEEDELNTQILTFPKALFANLFEFFDRYNFTVYEDSPDEHTVAVDPEMLGHIFENLLEDNKDKGAFYTPKEIVHYMCQESLIEYLYTKLNPVTTNSFQELGRSQTDMFGNGGKKGQLSLVQKHETPKEVVSRQALEAFIKQSVTGPILDYEEAILTALYTVKVCDPAIGSGAFPMGVLMEIFHAVETLFEASAAVTKKVWKLKGSDWVSNRAAIKAAIIQNSIYGVDIEQGAVDIARLRFWLSLVVDEEVPQPLPNLDYKIVVGNSLLSKFGDVVIDIDWDPKHKNASAVQKLITEQQVKLHLLQERQRLFFIAQHGDKQKLKREIRNLKIDILLNQLELTKTSFQQSNPVLGGFAPTEKERKKNLENTLVLKTYSNAIANLKALKTTKDEPLEFFDWKLDFPEVMNKKVAKEVGFDIVIANPPYVKVQNLDHKEIDIFKEKYFVAFKRLDISSLFFEILKGLLHRNGVSVYISSNQFLTSEYGRNLREFLTTEIGMHVNVDFGGLPVFDKVITYVSIFKLKKLIPLNLQYSKVASVPFIDEALKIEFIDYKAFGSEKWILSSGIKEKLLTKLNSSFEPLSSYAKCHYGIVSGADDIFIPTRQDAKKIGIEKKCLLPLVRANNCDRYNVVMNELFIIYPYEQIEDETVLIPLPKLKAEFPNTYNYLNSHKKQLQARKDSRRTFEKSENWYSLTRFGQLGNFKKTEKILFPGEQKQMKFGLNKNGAGYSGARVFGVSTNSDKVNLYYLLGVLNSKLIEFFVHNTFPLKQGNYFSMSSTQVDKLPIVIAASQIIIQKKVSQILEIKPTGVDTNRLEKEIDKLIYKIYQLSYEESCLIEGNADWATREEYESMSIDNSTETNTAV